MNERNEQQFEELSPEDSTDVFRHVPVVANDSLPEKYGVTLSARAIRSYATTQQPARIRITMENHSNIEQSYYTGYREVFGGMQSRERASRLMLLPPRMGLQFGETPLRPKEESVALDTPMVQNQLASGDQTTVEYDVFDHPGNTGDSLVPGSYRFEAEYHQSSNFESGKGEFQWGFNISIEEA
jgi:hypothetical protein